MSTPSRPAKNQPGGTRLPGQGIGGRSFYIPVAHANLELPVRITEAGESWWAYGDVCERKCSAIWAVELVRRGSLHFSQDGTSYTVGVGQGFILKRGSQHVYRANQEGVRKSYLGFEGTVADRILANAPDVVHWRDLPRAQMLFRRLHAWVDKRQGDWQTSASIDAYALMLEIAHSGVSHEDRGRHLVLERVLPLLEASQGHACRIAEIARIAGVSPAQLHRLFQEEMHTTPRHYANTFAMRRAQHALQYSTRSCADIAAELGYQPHYFSAIFRRLVGMSPQRFRMKFT